jgi:hypothetical protein
MTDKCTNCGSDDAEPRPDVGGARLCDDCHTEVVADHEDTDDPGRMP